MTQIIETPYALGSPPTLSKTHVIQFIVRLRELGYSECKLLDKSRIVEHFVKWAQTWQIPAIETDDTHITQFLEQSGQPSRERFAFKRALLQRFLCYLRQGGVANMQPGLGAETETRQIEQDYTDYLRDERGLSVNSLLVYLPHIRAFLSKQIIEYYDISSENLNATVVRTFLLDRIQNRSEEYARLVATSLRSFLHFLFLRGATQNDLSLAITTVRKQRGSTLHSFLSPAEVERVLSTPNLETPTGRRDHAILLLLARLGLRANEVVALELDDITWRSGELVVRGKGRINDRLPLLMEVGTALALYIESVRGPSECRRVFIRRIAPRVGFAGPAAIGHVVRRTMYRAGLPRPSGVAAHLFRHSLATNMLHQGASLPEISEVLRHRSVTTTEIYAKAAFESLREVARPWPSGEVGR